MQNSAVTAAETEYVAEKYFDMLFRLCLGILASTADAEERDTGILESLFALPPKYRTVLYLHYIEGYKTDEMADILNASVSAVKKRLQYARERLKKEYMKGEKML